MSGIPVVLCGKSPMLATSFISALQSRGPQVDVVHVIHDAATGARELPALLNGEDISPSSELGTNAESGRQHRVPLAVVVGKGFNEDEIAELRSIKDAQNVPWLLPDDAQMTWTRIAKVVGSAGMALPGVVADRVIACLEKNGMLGTSDKSADRKGQVWWF